MTLALGILALGSGCGDDGAGDEGATTGADGMTASTVTATTGSTETSSATASAGTMTSTGGGTTADGSTGPGEPVACGEELICAIGEVCVVPCCGGPQPACFELPPDGDCGNGYPDDNGTTCCDSAPDPRICMMTEWCVPGPCIPNPPFCIPADMVFCNEVGCSVKGGCGGALMDGVLQCRGCK